jgi:hypothetical protein
MQATRYTSFITTSLLLVGSFCIFRNSPWQAEAKATSTGKRQSPQNQAKQEASLPAPVSRRGILGLADPNTFKRVVVRPEVRSQIARIAQRLERETLESLRQAISHWKQSGGYRDGQMPTFMQATNQSTVAIYQKKDYAEREAFDLLTPKEQESWKNNSPSALSKLASLQVIE